MTCEVCGREKAEIEEEFGLEIQMSEHQGIRKCSKCIKEYEREMGDTGDDDMDKDWKSKITA